MYLSTPRTNARRRSPARNFPENPSSSSCFRISPHYSSTTADGNLLRHRERHAVLVLEKRKTKEILLCRSTRSSFETVGTVRSPHQGSRISFFFSSHDKKQLVKNANLAAVIVDLVTNPFSRSTCLVICGENPRPLLRPRLASSKFEAFQKGMESTHPG